MGNTDSSAADRDDRLCFERASMSSEYVAHQGNALRRGNIWEAHQARMLEASHVHEFSEIGVYIVTRILSSAVARSSSA